ncbi:MAG: hypothetical protein WAW37_14000 [Syntrophobacteraceae bacterium]
MKKALLAIPGILAASSCFAADVPFTVTAPTFDWSVLGTIAVAMLTVGVGMALFRRSKSVLR